MFANISNTEHSYHILGSGTHRYTPGTPLQRASHRQFRTTTQVIFQAALSSAPLKPMSLVSWSFRDPVGTRSSRRVRPAPSQGGLASSSVHTRVHPRMAAASIYVPTSPQ